MQYIERSGRKMNFHLGGLKLEELAKEAMEEIRTEADPREQPCMP
jgi:hypothetical protein